MDSLNPKEYNPLEGKKKSAKYTQEQLDFIYSLVVQGWSAHKIAQAYGIDRESIKKRIIEDSWIANNNRNGALSNEQLQEMKKMVDDKLSSEYICEYFKISKESLLRRIANNKWQRTPRKSTYHFNQNYFSTIDTPSKAYWLGFIYADGYILSKRNRMSYSQEQQSFGFSISTIDIELFEKFKRDINSNHPITIEKNNLDKSMGRILLTSQITVNDLKKQGVFENKTFFLTFPNEQQVPSLLIPHFIRGYSDGDGSIIIDKNYKFQWNLCGTKELLMGIQTFFSTSVKLSQRYPERHNNNWTLTYSGNLQVPRLLSIIYQEPVVYLERKYQKYSLMLKYDESQGVI